MAFRSRPAATPLSTSDALCVHRLAMLCFLQFNFYTAIASGELFISGSCLIVVQPVLIGRGDRTLRSKAQVWLCVAGLLASSTRHERGKGLFAHLNDHFTQCCPPFLCHVHYEIFELNVLKPPQSVRGKHHSTRTHCDHSRPQRKQ